jgi:hypothetical protein
LSRPREQLNKPSTTDQGFHPSHTATGNNSEDRVVPPEFDALLRWRNDAFAAIEFRDKADGKFRRFLSRSR